MTYSARKNGVMLSIAVAAFWVPSVLRAQASETGGREWSGSAVAARLVRLLQENDRGLNSMLQSVPDSASAKGLSFRQVIVEHIDHYAPPDSLTSALAKAYMEKFTGEELKQLYLFLASPVGRKFNSSQPGMAQVALRRTNELLAPHSAELKQRTDSLIIRASTP